MADLMWAPWRKKYVASPSDEGCIFCIKPQEKKDRKNYILRRAKYSFALLNLYPYNNGHIMIAPYRHAATLSALKPCERNELWNMVVVFEEILQNALNPHGFNIGLNVGKAGGAGFDEHLHIHIVPRWSGDTNFMPVLADIKVIPESMESVYQVLTAEMRKRGGSAGKTKRSRKKRA
ncbi:MAG: HIT domain-containing protein [Candidatus Omnitrophica bacterium]|nr:HIT domain-containing protein [Candidatus Omnitrophota bacterium]